MAVYTPQEITQQLAIEPGTLRKWALEFKRYLSTSAAGGSVHTQRRYVDQDVTVLAQIQQARARNLTYAEIHSLLRNMVSTADEQTTTRSDEQSVPEHHGESCTAETRTGQELSAKHQRPHHTLGAKRITSATADEEHYGNKLEAIRKCKEEIARLQTHVTTLSKPVHIKNR